MPIESVISCSSLAIEPTSLLKLGEPSCMHPCSNFANIRGGVSHNHGVAICKNKDRVPFQSAHAQHKSYMVVPSHGAHAPHKSSLVDAIIQHSFASKFFDETPQGQNSK